MHPQLPLPQSTRATAALRRTLKSLNHCFVLAKEEPFVTSYTMMPAAASRKKERVMARYISSPAVSQICMRTSVPSSTLQHGETRRETRETQHRTGWRSHRSVIARRSGSLIAHEGSWRPTGQPEQQLTAGRPLERT